MLDFRILGAKAVIEIGIVPGASSEGTRQPAIWIAKVAFVYQNHAWCHTKFSTCSDAFPAIVIVIAITVHIVRISAKLFIVDEAVAVVVVVVVSDTVHELDHGVFHGQTLVFIGPSVFRVRTLFKVSLNYMAQAECILHITPRYDQEEERMGDHFARW